MAQSSIRPGMTVTLTGLRGAPHLNGRVAQVLELDKAAGRWKVDLGSVEGVKALKPENLVSTDAAVQEDEAEGVAGSLIDSLLLGGHSRSPAAEFEDEENFSPLQEESPVREEDDKQHDDLTEEVNASTDNTQTCEAPVETRRRKRIRHNKRKMQAENQAEDVQAKPSTAPRGGDGRDERVPYPEADARQSVGPLLRQLSVKELKQKLTARGVSIPVGLTEKSELLALLQKAPPSAEPQATTAKAAPSSATPADAGAQRGSQSNSASGWTPPPAPPGYSHPWDYGGYTNMQKPPGPPGAPGAWEYGSRGQAMPPYGYNGYPPPGPWGPGAWGFRPPPYGYPPHPYGYAPMPGYAPQGAYPSYGPPGMPPAPSGRASPSSAPPASPRSRDEAAGREHDADTIRSQGGREGAEKSRERSQSGGRRKKRRRARAARKESQPESPQGSSPTAGRAATPASHPPSAGPSRRGAADVGARSAPDRPSPSSRDNALSASGVWGEPAPHPVSDRGSEELKNWLSDLDGGRGALERYLQPLQDSYGSLKALAKTLLAEPLSSSVVGRVDPSLWDRLGVDALGHRLLIAKGVVALGSR